MAHLGCFLPIIVGCFYTYFMPADFTPEKEEQAACNQSYRLYLLVSGCCLIPPTLMLMYIVGCHRRHSHQVLEDMSTFVLVVECIIFSAIFIYFKVLNAENDDVCENTGTLIGSLVMVPLYVAGASCSMFGACVLTAYIYLCAQDCLRKVCCCFGGTALLDRSLPKVSYSSKDFINETDCSICLNEFAEGEKVSPLHCNIKHVYHEKCIGAWLKRSPICPLCKAPISRAEQKLFNKDIKRLLKE